MEHQVWAPCRVWGGWLGLAPRQREHTGGPLSGEEVAGLYPSHQNECRVGEGTPRFGKQVFRGGPEPAFP